MFGAAIHGGRRVLEVNLLSAPSLRPVIARLLSAAWAYEIRWPKRAPAGASQTLGTSWYRLQLSRAFAGSTDVRWVPSAVSKFRPAHCPRGGLKKAILTGRPSSFEPGRQSWTLEGVCC